MVGLLALMVASCATPGGGSSAPVEIRQGRIEQITEVQLVHPHQLGVGAILGGIGGAAIGSLVGGGSGRDVAVAIGALGGAAAGNYAQDKYQSKQPGQQIIVRLNSGVLVVITQAANYSLAVGERVYVEGSGSTAHVVAQ